MKTVFGSSMETDVLSEILAVLAAATDTHKQDDFIGDFLLFLTTVERFNSLVLFLSSEDKKGVFTFSYFKENEYRSFAMLFWVFQSLHVLVYQTNIVIGHKK